MIIVFYLDDDFEIDEPVGFADLEISIKRNDTFHGMVFEASTSSLEFYGDAAEYLREKYETEGVKASVKFTALEQCDGYDYVEVISGRLNFGKYKQSCGAVCTVTIPVEEDSCAVTLYARQEQKVDMDKETAADGFTQLPTYSALAQEIDLPAHHLQAAVEGYVADGGDTVDLDIFTSTTQNFAVRPTYGRPIYESINRSLLLPTVFAASDNGFNDSVIIPVRDPFEIGRVPGSIIVGNQIPSA